MAAPVFSEAEIRARLATEPVVLSSTQHAALARFLTLLAKWNRVHNLTGFRRPADLLERAVVESLQLLPHLAGSRVADVGSGGGLPGVPLAIASPTREFALLESRAKRVHFLRHVTGELGLTNTRVEHGRAEDLRPTQPFDTVLARAVAPPAELLAIVRQLTARGSILLLLTSAEIGEAYRGIAADFKLCRIEPLRPEAYGAIVRLERTEDSQT